MTPQEFASAGGKAMKGTPQAKERARKGGLAAAAKRKAESLASRSPIVRQLEDAGRIRRVDASEPDALRYETPIDSSVVYDKKEKWVPTPDME